MYIIFDLYQNNNSKNFYFNNLHITDTPLLWFLYTKLGATTYDLNEAFKTSKDAKVFTGPQGLPRK